MGDLIVVGDSTSTGGKVITGKDNIKVGGQTIAAVGDIATCASGKKGCRGQGPIVNTTPRKMLINGVLPAKEKDRVDCGCDDNILLPGQNSVNLGTVMNHSVNVGSGVNFGNNVNINKGATVSTTGRMVTDALQTVSGEVSSAIAAAESGFSAVMDKITPLAEELQKLKEVVRLVISSEVTGYTIQSLKGIKYFGSTPAVVVPTYKVDVLDCRVDADNRVVLKTHKFSFNVTRDAWYFLGEKAATEQQKSKNIFLNRAFIPHNYKQNLYGAYWIPSYPSVSATYLPSGLNAFIFTRFGNRAIPAKPLATQKKLDGTSIDSPRKDPALATDVMIHIGGAYWFAGKEYLGGSYGCFGFIPDDDIYSSPAQAEQASLDDKYDDETSNNDWKTVTEKILSLSFTKDKPLQILLEYRDETKNLVPEKILKAHI